jgi:hypothetical protein
VVALAECIASVGVRRAHGLIGVNGARIGVAALVPACLPAGVVGKI